MGTLCGTRTRRLTFWRIHKVLGARVRLITTPVTHTPVLTTGSAFKDGTPEAEAVVVALRSITFGTQTTIYRTAYTGIGTIRFQTTIETFIATRRLDEIQFKTSTEIIRARTDAYRVSPLLLESREERCFIGSRIDTPDGKEVQGDGE